jgi:hypothetical protein
MSPPLPMDDGYGIGLYAPAGFVTNDTVLERAVARLSALGHRIVVDESCTTRWQRFSATDDARLAAIGRMADDPRVTLAIAARGGYGWSRLLDRIDFAALAAKKKRWMGHSDFTAFQLAALAHAGMTTFGGPMASDFGAATPSAFTLDHCWGVLGSDRYEFRCDLEGPDIEVEGTLWGGNLAMVSHLVGTPHLPRVDHGICSSRTLANTLTGSSGCLSAPFRGNSGAATRGARRVQRLRARSNDNGTMRRHGRAFSCDARCMLYRPPGHVPESHTTCRGHCALGARRRGAVRPLGLRSRREPET